jgi:hypothetical protein
MVPSASEDGRNVFPGAKRWTPQRLRSGVTGENEKSALPVLLVDQRVSLAEQAPGESPASQSGRSRARESNMTAPAQSPAFAGETEA